MGIMLNSFKIDSIVWKFMGCSPGIVPAISFKIDSIVWKWIISVNIMTPIQ